MPLWAAAGAGAMQIGGSWLSGRGSRRRSRRAAAAAREAFNRAIGEYKAGLKPHRERYGRATGRLEEEAMRDYEEQAEKFFAPVAAAHEESLARSTPSLRAGQVGRGQFTSGGGAAQEAEMFRRGAIDLAVLKSGTQREQQARTDALLQYLTGETRGYEQAGVDLPLKMLGFETGMIGQRYGGPSDMESIGAGMMGGGQQLAQLAMLNYLYPQGGGGGGGWGYTGGHGSGWGPHYGWGQVTR